VLQSVQNENGVLINDENAMMVVLRPESDAVQDFASVFGNPKREF
jgi:hypothetical protein